MSREALSKYIGQIAYKKLSAVEADWLRSNQHELNGVTALRDMLGTARRSFDTIFVYLGDEEDENIFENGEVTWYDARETHPTRSEWRLYYPSNEVTRRFAEGAILLVGKRNDIEGQLLFITAERASGAERQLAWLFGFHPGNLASKFVMSQSSVTQQEVGFTARRILEAIGVDAFIPQVNYLEQMLQLFGEKFPRSDDFSRFARSTAKGPNPLDNPDDALMAWLEHEELLFRTLERHLLEDRIRTGFDSVDEFVQVSLSVQNRRKARAGRALENHLREIFNRHGISFVTGEITENRSKPDFIFPGIAEYRNSLYPADRLTILGAKTSCKDRWRQVLAEAERIREKHLLTLEPGISLSQTNEMLSHHLQLVVPQRIHATYLPQQQSWLMNLSAFLEMIRIRQVNHDNAEAADI